MPKKVISADEIQLIGLFESLTGAKVKDCLNDEHSITFIVEENEAGKAIGKNGAHVKRLGAQTKKNIKIIEFSPQLEQFLQNIVHPLQIASVKQDEIKGKVVIIITPVDLTTRGYLIGHAGSTLRSYETIVKMYFPIDEIKVV